MINFLHAQISCRPLHPATTALAQAPPLPQPSDAARALVGAWELSNPDRDRRCTLTFKLDPAPQGRAVTLGPTCAAAFPDLRPTAAWTMGSDDALKLVDAKGAVLFELTEVENGMYETTPSHTRYFLQTLAAINKDRITDDLFGDWQITRGPAARSARSPRQHRLRHGQLRAHAPARLRCLSSPASLRSPGNSIAASS